MCAIDNLDPWTVSRQETRTARKSWVCQECKRTIQPGERYEYLAGLLDGRWSSWWWCRHCAAAGVWLEVVCGGYPMEMLLEELVEHWWEGYRSVAYARLIAGIKHRWHDGRDPVPTGVGGLASAMMREQVAA